MKRQKLTMDGNQAAAHVSYVWYGKGYGQAW